MTTNMHEFWQTCVEQLAQELPPQQIRAWVRPLAPLAFDEAQAVLRVAAPNPFKLKWARENYLTRIEALASDWYERPVQVVFELEVSARTSAPKTAPVHASAAASSQAPAAALPVVQAAPQPAEHNGSGLIADFSFENFVTGKANQFAHAAALQVAENPGGPYNPLFLYGASGLGKTHLMNAIGHALLASDQKAKVRYVHAKRYVSDMIRAIRRQETDSFTHYYQSLDLLLIDDIQFFVGKERTQEEFFHTFEAMIAQRKQIIITSDKYPKELPIDSRLSSRFGSGLTAAVDPPELEMRVAILLRKAQIQGIAMPEDVAFFIAKHVRSNVRELEGALNTAWAYYANFPDRRGALSVEICKQALRGLLSTSNGQITIENIQKTVAEYFKIRVADMYSKRRTANIVVPRQVAMFLARELTDKSLPEIAGMFAKKDHTTVMNALDRISVLRQKQPALHHAIHLLEQTLRA